MGSIVSTVLITAPLAFMAGWILAKAVLRYTGPAARESDYRKLLQQQQAAVAERDGRIAELHAEIDAAEARLLDAGHKFGTWQERIRPIARQFRQQRAIINELRDELRRRDAAQREAEEKLPQSRAKTAPTGRAGEPQRESISRLDTVS